VVTPDVVATVHDAGLGVCVWTVDETSEAEAMLRVGVDAITTNFPERVVAIARGAR